MANVNSKFFDGIKISKKQESKKEDNCQWEDCEMPAVHKAPKGEVWKGNIIILP